MILYTLPDAGSDVVASIPSTSPVSIIARSQDFTWLQARTEEGATGWVPASQVSTNSCLDALPALHAQEDYRPQRPISLELQGYPYLKGLCARSREIFLHGLELGNRSEVFSKIGDSITISSHFLAPIGYGEYWLDQYTHLQEVIDFYSTTNARLGNSFVNPSLSAFGGWSSWTVVNFHAADPGQCLPGEVPLECELRLVKPAVALIMLGTNDVVDPDLITPKFYEENIRKVIETCIQNGVIPVLSTIPAMFLPEFTEREPVFNAIIIRLADEYDIPLWDYHAALDGLPNSGLIFDGVHPSVAPGGAGDFSPAGLQYGMNVRNLTALQVLDAIWRGVIR
ncbi:MAG: hypothetical protein HND51_18260 [Chloroflexi bacterium]|nr:hypothetical protein [Chloroflexota bacterium]